MGVRVKAGVVAVLLVAAVIMWGENYSFRPLVRPDAGERRTYELIGKSSEDVINVDAMVISSTRGTIFRAWHRSFDEPFLRRFEAAPGEILDIEFAVLATGPLASGHRTFARCEITVNGEHVDKNRHEVRVVTHRPESRIARAACGHYG